MYTAYQQQADAMRVEWCQRPIQTPGSLQGQHMRAASACTFTWWCHTTRVHSAQPVCVCVLHTFVCVCVLQCMSQEGWCRCLQLPQLCLLWPATASVWYGQAASIALAQVCACLTH